VIYTAVNIILRKSAWDPYPFILAKFIFVDAGGYSSAGDHDEPEPAGHERTGCAANWILT